MISLYGFCFIVGGIFVALAAIAGLDGADFDSHFEIDLSGEIGPGIGNERPALMLRQLLAALFPILSLRFWTFGSFVFGMMGLLLTLLATDLSPSLKFGISLATGLAFGSLIVAILRSLKGQGDADSLIRSDDLVGALGVVEIPFDTNSRGKIRVEIKGSQVFLKAVTNEVRSFEQGDRVLVLGMEDNRAWVVSEASTAET
jgi:hypothetical protein